MKKIHYIYEKGDHKWAMVTRDPEKPDHLIDTNEYLIIQGNKAILTDPGGSEIFPEVFSAINTEFDARNISALFSSHQDPDVISSLGLWLDFNPNLKCYLSWLWSSFIPHFGGNANTFITLPDAGGEIRLGNLTLQAIPAHYLHSSGNFNLYDPIAKILFSGDIGAALIPADEDYLIVDDFDKHIRYAKGFHQRWMGSNDAKLDWCERVEKLNIDMLCPQHGAIYQGADVQRFINWFAELPIGIKLHQK
jgi:flavorubredoxin